MNKPGYVKGTPVPDPTNPGRMIVSRRPIGYVRVTEVTSDSAQAVFAGGGPGPITVGQILEPAGKKEAEDKIKVYARNNRRR